MSSLTDTSCTAQRHRLLTHLRTVAPIHTLLARRDLNILMPATRIKELREQGHEIHTQRITVTDEHGRAHHGVALYTLIRLAGSGRATA